MARASSITDTFKRELAELINKHSLENDWNMPDFLLAAYLCECLDALYSAVDRRQLWNAGNPGGSSDV